jgi:hypothetical protein
MTLPWGPLGPAAVDRKGALYLSGPGECCGGGGAYLFRLSVKGRVDSRFDAVARHSLRALGRLGARYPEISALVPRRRRLDLLGPAGASTGFQLRLRADGHRQRTFAASGLRRFVHPIVAAAHGVDGAIFAVQSSTRLRGSLSALRILPDGRLDQQFGVAPVPNSANDFGLSVVPQTGRRALLLDLGRHGCRSYCPPTPKLVRFLEGSRGSR